MHLRIGIDDITNEDMFTGKIRQFTYLANFYYYNAHINVINQLTKYQLYDGLPLIFLPFSEKDDTLTSVADYSGNNRH